MFTPLKNIMAHWKHRRQRTTLLKELDIGEGTRISVSSVDGVFPHLIHIGKNCIIAPGAMLLTHDASRYLIDGRYRAAPVFIGDNCFIGYNAAVMPGVAIGDNVIVGACSLVTSDVPSNTVVCGVPARHLCSVSEYQNADKGDLYAAPFAGKRPCDVDQNDIEVFRRKIYPLIRK